MGTGTCRQIHLLMIGVLLALLAPASAQAEWTSLEGKEAPALEIEAWLAEPEGRTLRDLRGSVVVLLLGGAIDLSDAVAVTRWSDLRAGWWAKGLRVVLVLAEAPAALPPAAQFSVAVGTSPAYGNGSVPRALLIAADGTVAWEGDPGDLTDAPIAQGIRKARAFELGLSGSEAKAPAATAFKKGKLAEARALATGSEAGGAGAVAVTARVTALLAYWRRQAERAAATGSHGEATACLKRIAKHFAGAAEAAEAAEALKALKANQDVSKEASAADAYARLRQGLAKAVGNRKKIAALVKRAERAAKRKPMTQSVERAARLVLQLRADPAVAALKAFIAKAKIKTKGARWRNNLPKPPQVEFVAGKTYLWHLETNQGPLTVRFLPDGAPMHVSSAMYLTLLGFYDGLVFHRVIPGFMAQGGCPDGSGGGRIGYLMDGEFEGDARHDARGRISAANAGPGTDSSQFFITFAAAAHLDTKHTIYGVLVKGEGTLKKIEKLGSADGPTKSPVVIEAATISVE